MDPIIAATILEPFNNTHPKTQKEVHYITPILLKIGWHMYNFVLNTLFQMIFLFNTKAYLSKYPRIPKVQKKT